MIRVAFVVYRQWAFDIYQSIFDQMTKYDEYSIPLLITTSKHEFSLSSINPNLMVEILDGKNQEGISILLAKYKIDVVMFYGWSWIVKEPILSNYICLCLHPSPLPKYRGGTPIQHQIVAGETMSAVSVIKMNEGIDSGDIYEQIPFSLAGTLDEILFRIIDIGTVITRNFLEDMINDQIVFTSQSDLENHPPLKRRKQDDGQIDLEKVKNRPYVEIYNLVRGLTDPYPNAYIVLSDGVLYLQAVRQRKIITKDVVLLSSNTKGLGLDVKSLAIPVSDGYALVISSKFKV
ncbi:MAG: formyltransferase family protein [Candidatus Paceibacterota bacterium]